MTKSSDPGHRLSVRTTVVVLLNLDTTFSAPRLAIQQNLGHTNLKTTLCYVGDLKIDHPAHEHARAEGLLTFRRLGAQQDVRELYSGQPRADQGEAEIAQL